MACLRDPTKAVESLSRQQEQEMVTKPRPEGRRGRNCCWNPVGLEPWKRGCPRREEVGLHSYCQKNHVGQARKSWEGNIGHNILLFLISYQAPSIGQIQPEARAQGGPSMCFVETSSLEHRPEGEDGDWIWLGNSTE